MLKNPQPREFLSFFFFRELQLQGSYSYISTVWYFRTETTYKTALGKEVFIALNLD